MNDTFNYKRAYIYIFIFCYALIVWRVYQVPLYGSDQGRNFMHGDEYSDKNAHSTAMYLYDYPFLSSTLLPVWDYKGDGDTTKKGVYTHYPALPDILAAVYSRVLNTKSDQLIRVFPIALSVLFFLLIIRFENRFIADKRAAFYSAAVILLSNYFIAWADNLHKHLYEELIKWAFVLLLYNYFENEKRPKKYLGILSLLFIIVANISFEPIVYLAVITVGFCWIYQKRIVSLETIVLGLSAVLGFGLHLWQNSIYFHGWEKVFTDMSGALTQRTVGDTHIDLGRRLTFSDYCEIPFLWFNRLERAFLIPGWAILVFAFLAMKKYYHENRKLFHICVVVFLATISWSIVMSQHFLVHLFTVRHWGIWVGLVIGVGMVEYLDWLKLDFKSKNVYKKSAHVIFIGYIVIMLLSQQVFDLYLKNGFLYPLLGK